MKNPQLQTSAYYCSKHYSHNSYVKINVLKDEMVKYEGEHTHNADLVKKNVESLVRETLVKCVENPTILPHTAKLMKDLVMPEEFKKVTDGHN